MYGVLYIDAAACMVCGVSDMNAGMLEILHVYVCWDLFLWLWVWVRHRVCCVGYGYGYGGPMRMCMCGISCMNADMVETLDVWVCWTCGCWYWYGYAAACAAA
jgi:hypothetical protein